jgi:EAL and modified HD-GYP domain-containing signal transduction protein
VTDLNGVHSANSSLGDATQMVHIGRQAVYNRAGEVVGYELLFRGSADAVEASRRGAHATSQVIVNAFTEFGLEQLVGDLPCFVNLTRDFLVGDLPVPFDPGLAVLEILETVEVDDEVVVGVAALANEGYQIALDDFVYGLGHERLLGLATFLKVDMLIADPDELADAVANARKHKHLKLVAERLETDEHVQLARELGFDLYQGYALSRPQVLSVVSLNPSRMQRLELLGLLTSEDINMNQMVEIVTTDPALCYRILRATNSASAGLPRKVSSVHDAVVLLGTARIRQWVALMLISDIADATDDQLSTIMTRARLCQMVAERLDLQSDSAFTVGLLSGVADLIAEPVSEVVGKLPLTNEVAEALTAGRGRLGDVLAVVRAYEVSDVPALSTAPVSSAELARAYLSAVGWSMRTIDGALGPRGSR